MKKCTVETHEPYVLYPESNDIWECPDCGIRMKYIVNAASAGWIPVKDKYMS